MNAIPAAKNRAPDALAVLPLSALYPHPDDPFSVREDDAMGELAESVASVGVLNPALVRPRGDGGYEILSGKRRKRASELAGKEEIPSSFGI